MKTIAKKMLLFYGVGFFFLLVLAGIELLLSSLPSWIGPYYQSFVFGKYILLCIFIVFLTLFVVDFSKLNKVNIPTEIILIDIPAVLMLTYLEWRRYLYNAIQDISAGFASYLQAENTFHIFLILGSVLAGIELIRYSRYLKCR